VRPGQSQWTRRYVQDREIAGSGQWRISPVPEAAADDLVALTGGVRRARQWAVDLLAALAARRPT
jgi:hypothetical protein